MTTISTCYYCGSPVTNHEQRCQHCASPLVIKQRYRPQHILARGGYGTVYTAFDTRLNRICAIKVISTVSAIEQKQAEAEARVLSHYASILPFIPDIYDFWSSPTRTYLVMEYIDGPTLDDVVGTPWTARRVVAFLQIFLDYLIQLHAVGIVHRDIKPANIKITPQGRFVLLDFGIASGHIQPHPPQALSVEYAAPEQFQTGVTDARSDLYSLAATAYHLLTGTPIPSAAQRLSTSQALTPPALLNTDTGPLLNSLLLDMLAVDPQQRPKTAADALARIGREHMAAFHGLAQTDHQPGSSAGKPTVAHGSMTIPYAQVSAAAPPPARVASRSPAYLRLISALAGGLLVVAALIAWHQRPQPGLTPPPAVEASTKIAAADDHAEQATTPSTSPSGVIDQQPEPGTEASWPPATPAPPPFAQVVRTLIPKAHTTTASQLSLGFTPDGKQLISGELGEPGYIWPLYERAAPQRLGSADSAVDSLAISPDGRRIATVSLLGSIELWQLPNAAHELSLGRFGGISADFSPDGALLAVGRTRDVQIWSMESHTLVQTIQQEGAPVISVAFSSLGNLLATGSVDGSVQIWRLDDGTRIRKLTQHSDQISSVAFSPDGTTIASSSYDGTVRLWSLEGEQLRVLRHPGAALSVAFSPSGNTVAVGGSDSTITIWNTEHAMVVASLLDWPAPIRAVSFSPDGRLLASGTNDGTIQLWRVISDQ